jgi:hypothetical protein
MEMYVEAKLKEAVMPLSERVVEFVDKIPVHTE